MTRLLTALLVPGLAAVLLALPAAADPCGMVPPIYTGQGVPIVRTGEQRTYVFHKNGIETVVIRPGFSGKVDDFGMLIPFPTPPSIRKVPDDIFGHIAAAIDPPEVVIDLSPPPPSAMIMRSMAAEDGLAVVERLDNVTVLREEAVGMYEVAVLDAGSARALKRWMENHGYVYPNGMEPVCEEYIGEGWCFVAVKTRVGRTSAVTPRPGMREADATLPDGFGFDGFVQAMGFRFRSDELVLPMRLSTFNGDDLHNVVYALTEGPCQIPGIDKGAIVRQISGADLYRNVTTPLPLRVIGGTIKDIPDWQREGLAERRDPTPHNGAARELFAADLLAAATGKLEHAFEDMEKELLSIGERLGLRGPELDRMHHDALASERSNTLGTALAALETMTLTVIDGDFPKALLARENLTVAPHAMPEWRNTPGHYDATLGAPAPKKKGRLYRTASAASRSGDVLVGAGFPVALVAWIAAPLLIGLLLLAGRRRLGTNVIVGGVALGLALSAATSAGAQSSPPVGDAADLFQRAKADGRIVERGRAIVALADSADPRVDGYLRELARSEALPSLVRTWAQAARIERADFDALVGIAAQTQITPALNRPMGLRLQALLAAEGTMTTAGLLTLIARVPSLQAAASTSILARGTDPLVEVMRTHREQDIRRLAAAYLGTLAARDPGANVAAAIVRAYAFSVDRDGVPWANGPLFIPALQWGESSDDATRLARHLIAWHLWADRFNRADLQNQIANNLRSIQLAPAAGYQLTWGENSTADWLRAWKLGHGRTAVLEILREQGVQHDAKYRAALDADG